jgi:hypothetical protein
VAAFALTVGVQIAVAEPQVTQRTDPTAESPAGVIYQIPLDSARRDAAPVLPTGRRDDSSGSAAAGSGGGGSGGSGGGGSGGGSGGAGGSGAGSSSPGGGAGGSSQSAGAHGGTGATLSASSASEGGGTPQNPSSIHSENGFGSASQVPGVSQAALRTGAGVAATRLAGSTMPTYLLIVLIVVAAIGMGLLATRRSRRGEGRFPSAGDT